MKSLTFTCIGRNEKAHLEKLLPVLLAIGSDVVYVDCESDDQSFEYAQGLGCLSFRRENNMNLNVNKSFAMEQATTPWVFYIDPDERLPANLLVEIKNKIKDNPLASGNLSEETGPGSPSSKGPVAYRLARKNHYFGQWLKYGGQYPDNQLRLFLKEKGKFPNQHVHESLVIDGKIGKLKNPMEHYPYLTLSQYFKKFDFYSSFEAQHLYDQGVRPSLFNLLKYVIFKSHSRFLRRYFLKGGFRDGVPGLFAALGDTWGWMVRYFKLWEIDKDQKNSTEARS